MGSLVALNPSTNVLVSMNDFTKDYVDKYLDFEVSPKQYTNQCMVLQELHVHKKKKITHFTNDGRPCLFGFSMATRHKNCSIETYTNRWSKLGTELSPTSKEPVSYIYDIFNSLSIGVDKKYKKRDKTVKTTSKKRLDNDTYVYHPDRKSQKHRNMVQGRTKEAREIVQEGHTLNKEDGQTVKKEDDEDEQMLHQSMKVKDEVDKDKEMDDLDECDDEMEDDLNVTDDTDDNTHYEQDMENDYQDDMEEKDDHKVTDHKHHYEQDMENDDDDIIQNDPCLTPWMEYVQEKMEDLDEEEDLLYVMEDQVTFLRDVGNG
jgi:hypothetical protein